MTVLTTQTVSLASPKITFFALCTVWLGLTCLMLHVPFLNKCYWTAVVMLAFSGFWYKEVKPLFKEPIIILGLILVMLFTIGLFYSVASWKYGFRAWDKYLKILYLLFFIPFFVRKDFRRITLFIMLSSVMVSELFTYLHYFGLISFGLPITKHWLFVQDIDAGFIVSFAAYVFANLAVDSRKLRWVNLACLFICSVDILILNIERSGYLIYLGLAGLFVWQRFNWKGVLSALLIGPLLLTAFYFGTPQFRDRTTQIVTNVVDYHHGVASTSIGLRLAFAEYSFKMIKNHLAFGLGTGSFEEMYRAANGPKINNETWPAHPHNEYINILFQIGVLGLVVFIYWIYLQIRASYSLPRPEKFLLQGLILGFLLLGLCNASLLVNPAGVCYITLLAVFLAAKHENRA